VDLEFLTGLREEVPAEHRSAVDTCRRHLLKQVVVVDRSQRSLYNAAVDYRTERNIYRQVAEALAEVSVQGRDPMALVEAAVRAIETMPRVESGCIVLFQPDSHVPLILRTIRLEDDDRQRMNHEISHGIIAQVRAGEGEKYIGEATADPEASKYISVQTLKMRTVYCCPIPALDEGAPRGAIYLENREMKDAFPDSWRHAVQLLAQQLGVVLSILDKLPEEGDATAPYRTDGRFEEVVGVSPALGAVLRSVDKILANDHLRTVLITGETGVGKDLMAEMLHRHGPRSQGPLVRQNAAALPPNLAESELFGSTRGAYTDAADRQGLFQRASGGILFLNEIIDLPLKAQAKLLEVFDTHRVRRLGSHQEEDVDVWVITATNQDLQNAVGAGEFREDLYYRLSEHMVWIPPLRRRKEDIATLAEHFARVAAEKLGQPTPYLAPDLVVALSSMSWRGNVRELRNTVFQLVESSRGNLLTSELLLDRGDRCAEEADAEQEWLQWAPAVRRFKRTHLLWAIDRWGPSLSNVAYKLGVSRTHVYKLCRQLGVQVET